MLLLASALVTQTAFAASPSPERVVSDLYRAWSGSPQRRASQSRRLVAIKKFVVPDLYRDLIAIDRLDDPITGKAVGWDVFFGRREIPSGWGLDPARIELHAARVYVRLNWTKAETTRLAVDLARRGAEWTITNVIYPDGRELRGELRQILERNAAETKSGRAPATRESPPSNRRPSPRRP